MCQECIPKARPCFSSCNMLMYVMRATFLCLHVLLRFKTRPNSTYILNPFHTYKVPKKEQKMLFGALKGNLFKAKKRSSSLAHSKGKWIWLIQRLAMVYSFFATFSPAAYHASGFLLSPSFPYSSQTATKTERCTRDKRQLH